MSNRKLQKEIDIVFKKIQEGLHEFNYHYDRYESINTDDDSDNQREKEKLENDLKKEIKRLQKFREQIKIWQSTEAIKSLTLSSSTLSNKLNDNKHLIEEAMEVYKDVERQSKLKTFSNQSILMSALDSTNDRDDDSDDSDDDDFDFDDEDSSEDEEEDSNLSADAIEAIKFLKDIIHQISEQSKKLSSEFEKLSQKKLRKNNLSIIESKKERIKANKDSNKFHTKKMLKIIKLLRASKLSDINLIWIIKDDLNNYVSSNNSGADTTVVSDSTLYDDIFNSITVEEDYSEIAESEVFSTPVKEISKLSNGALQNGSHVNGSNPKDILTNDLTSHSRNHVNESTHVSPIQRKVPSPELSNPGIIKILKPATTPSKPIGGLQWSAAAAAGIPELSAEKSITEERVVQEPVQPIKQKQEEIEPAKSRSQISVEASSLKDDTNSPGAAGESSTNKYVQVLKNSSLSNIELNLFSDPNLHKLPPGMQDLIISFTSKRNNSHDFTLLYDSNEYNQYVTPINKPYLPSQIQPLHNNSYNSVQYKAPLQLFKLQSYWNKIRAGDQFDQFLTELESLIAQNNIDNIPIINELALVLFYGYYYGLTPIENLIAESSLFQLGWKPYRNKNDDLSNQSNLATGSSISSLKFSGSSNSSNSYLYWFRCVKLISSHSEGPSTVQIGDYQVFDLSSWEIFVKYSFKFDFALSQTSPATFLG